MSATVSTVSTLITALPTRTIVTNSGRTALTSTLFSTTTSFVLSTFTPSPTTTPEVTLETKIDPGFAVLGVVLILTGLPSAFLGHKNRWSSYFLTGFYTLAIVCLALILKFGVLAAVNPPSRTLRGLFVLSCGIAGIGGGAVCILFWNQARYFVGGLGGFAIALWLQCFRNGGVIRAIGYRWILYIACGVIGFILCTLPKFHYHILLISTAMVGATAFMLGVDCFTLVGLKEFYVYNLGFRDLFPKYANKPFPVTQTMQIELGLIAAAALAGAAIQFRVLQVLQVKLMQIREDQKRRDGEVEARAAERFKEIERDLHEWEKEHGPGSARPLLQSPDTTGALSGDTLIGRRARVPSDLSDFRAAPRDIERGLPVTDNDRRQSVGILPVMNLGADIETTLPTHFVSPDGATDSGSQISQVRPTQLRSGTDAILADIQEIRKSIDWLRQTSPAASVAGSSPLGQDSRKLSSSSRRFSQDLDHTFRLDPIGPSARPRVQSMDMTAGQNDSLGVAADGRMIGRTTSTPLRDDEWDNYVQERKLFTPPVGPSAPIPTSRPLSASILLDIPESVKKALDFRKRRESVIEMASRREPSPEPVDEVTIPTPPAARPTLAPVQILPPQPKKVPESPEPRTHTFEELAERHRRKMRDLQRPLSIAEKEQAALNAAKSRWERSMQVEKQEFDKRHAEKTSTVKDKGPSPSRGSKDQPGQPRGRKDRASTSGLTSDKVATIPAQSGHGRRFSAAKVLEWQKMQQGDVDVEQTRASSPAQGARPRHDVPFPGFEKGSRPPRDLPTRATSPR